MTGVIKRSVNVRYESHSVYDLPTAYHMGINIEQTWGETDFPVPFGMLITLKSSDNRRTCQLNIGSMGFRVRSSSLVDSWNGDWMTIL